MWRNALTRALHEGCFDCNGLKGSVDIRVNGVTPMFFFSGFIKVFRNTLNIQFIHIITLLMNMLSVSELKLFGVLIKLYVCVVYFCPLLLKNRNKI